MASDSFPNTPLPSEGSRRVAFADQKGNVSARSFDTSSLRSSGQSQKYGRRASVFIFDHLSDMKDAGLGLGEKCNYWIYAKIRLLSNKWFTHCFLIIVMILYTVGGAVIFLTIEGQNETKLIERDINLEVTALINELRIKSLSVPEQASEKEWIGEAARRLVRFETKLTAAFQQHPLVVSHINGRVWTIWNAVVYCSTLYTTIGYGHLYPTTFTGRVLTMVYSTIGIPLFLIALTDFGKLSTRGIKFVWSHIRRFYYTRSCRRVRKESHVKEIIKGAQAMYEYATFRRMSVWGDGVQTEKDSESAMPHSAAVISEPQTPAISSYEINDEFNLPISLALTMLVAYMLIGAAVFMVWEGWDFFIAFYFVFMSLSTIGFGDIIPERPIYMILSIVYLCFGLALMTMCINVVQDKLSDTFNHASARIGETMGIDVENGAETDDNVGKEENNQKDEDDDDDDNDDDDNDHESDDMKIETIENKDTDSKLPTIRVEESPFIWSTARVAK